MSSVAYGTSPLIAMERVQAVMQSDFAAELLDASVALAGLDLPPPDSADAYHLVPDQESAIARTQTERVAVYIWQRDDSVELRETMLLASPTRQEVDQLVYVSVMVAYRQTNADEFTDVGQTPELRSIVAKRGYRYVAAIKQLEHKRKFCGGGGIIASSIDSDKITNGEYNPAEETLRGFATVTLELTQWVYRNIA